MQHAGIALKEEVCKSLTVRPDLGNEELGRVATSDVELAVSVRVVVGSLIVPVTLRELICNSK
ncbi:MAG: hypothetical protein ACKPKO_25735 [Candidatus Fonsibacter sp.]